MNLLEAAALLGHAAAVIGVDTGLTHLAAELDVPLVAIYTDTDPALTGVVETARAANIGRAGEIPAVDAVLALLARVRGA
ncbi:Lipopolysaccharide heptosyltransferase 1 [compost metagenome]